MSFFGSAIHGLGHLIEKAAPFAGFIPGVGPVARAGLSLAGHALGGHDSSAPPSGGGLPSDNEVWGSETAPDQGGGIGGYLKNALGGINPLQAGLGALGVVNAGQLGAKANKYADQAMGDARGAYAERAGLRQKGIADMLHPQAVETSALTKIRSSNPYSGLPPAGAI